MGNNIKSTVSLFSGAGFGDMGFESAGFEHQLLCELAPSRTAFTSQNFPKAKILTVDIAKNVELISSEIQDSIKRNNKKPLFLLYATPPCQGISKNGIGTILKAMTEGKRSAVDKRNKLYLPVIDIVKANKPKWIFFENVCRLFNFKDLDTEGNIRKLTDIIQIEFYKLGYVGKFELVQMADYGLPQNRLRSVGIFRQQEGYAFNKDCSFLPPKIILDPSKRIKLKDSILKNESLDAFSHETRISKNNPLHRVPKWREELYYWMKHTPEGATAFDNNTCTLCNHENEKIDIECVNCKENLPKPTVVKKGQKKMIKGFVSAYKRMHWDKPASTITTRSAYASSDHKVHPSENRVLSIYEIAQLQGIDVDRVKWTDSNGKQFPDTLLRELIGESVPPLFTKIVGEHISKVEDELQEDVSIREQSDNITSPLQLSINFN